MAILASHNSFTYLEPISALAKIVLPFSRCQEVSIEQQYKLGVRMFDLRLKSKHQLVYVAHGLVGFDIITTELKALISYLDHKSTPQDPVYIRVLLENTHPSNQEVYRFVRYCEMLERTFKRVIFIGGNGAHRSMWYTLYYDFKNKKPPIQEYHASVCGCKLNILFLRRFAIKNNKRFRERNKDWNGYLMLDFVNH